MLIEFSVTNYRSFLERQTLNMAASSYFKELEPLNTFVPGQDDGVPRLLRLVREFQPEAIIVSLEQDVLDIMLVVGYIPAIMRTFALDGETLDAPSKIERLLGELAQTIRFYNDSHHDAPIRGATPIYLTGRLLSTAEAADLVRSTLERTVEWPRSPLPAPEALPVAEFMTNLGLALKKVP